MLTFTDLYVTCKDWFREDFLCKIILSNQNRLETLGHPEETNNLVLLPTNIPSYFSVYDKTGEISRACAQIANNFRRTSFRVH